jgi:GNAT superfamily N-acetyltransferase
MTWHIRPMQPREEEAYLSFLSAWVRSGVRDRYQWLYQNNPHGKALTWVAVESQTDRLVGCTSLFPKKMWLQNRIGLGAVGGDTYVDPLWRRRGIAEALHRVTLKDMRESGLTLHYGFPLPENLGAFRKAGAYLPGNFLAARLFLSLTPVLRKLKLDGVVPRRVQRTLDKVFFKATGPRISSSRDAKHFIRGIEGFDESFEVLTKEVLPFFKICCVRDCSYLRWRFLNNPFRQYTLLKAERKEDGRLDGFAAIEISGDTGQVSDFFARPEDDAPAALLTGVISLAVSYSLQSISMVVNPLGPYSHDLTRCGFRFNFDDQKTLMVLSDAATDGREDLANWYTTVADLDM